MLHKDLIVLIALNLDEPTLSKFCLISKKFGSYIDDKFWRLKLKIKDVSNPKKAYKQINTTKSLATASEDGDLYRVMYLVENGTNIHAYDDAALYWAVLNQQHEVALYLMENGAKLYEDV